MSISGQQCTAYPTVTHSNCEHFKLPETNKYLTIGTNIINTYWHWKYSSKSQNMGCLITNVKNNYLYQRSYNFLYAVLWNTSIINIKSVQRNSLIRYRGWVTEEKNKRNKKEQKIGLHALKIKLYDWLQYKLIYVVLCKKEIVTL